MTDDGAVIQTLCGARAELWAAGSPAVGQDEAARYGEAQRALRRWRGFPRRYPTPADELARRIDELVAGLRDAREADRRLVRPPIVDYRHVVATLLWCSGKAIVGRWAERTAPGDGLLLRHNTTERLTRLCVIPGSRLLLVPMSLLRRIAA